MKCEAFNFDMDCAFRLFSDGLSDCLSDFILGEFNFGGPVFFHCSDICAYGGFHFIGFSEVKNRSLTIALEPTRAAVRLAAVFLVFDCLVFML